MRILVIAAHPDDEVLGCGGTMKRLVAEGHGVYVLILGEGITSRYKKREIKKKSNEIQKLLMQAEKANRLLGAKEIFFGNFPDNRFDTVPLIDIVKRVEEVKKKVKANVVFTHYRKDLNVDHQITFKAVLTATRPMKGETVKEVYSFEVPSSTEWNYPLSFSPNVFFDITNTINAKVKALKIYSEEIRCFPHPRSEEFIRLNAKILGSKIGLRCAEGFELVRSINVIS